MSDKFTPIVPPDALTVNLNRGLKGFLEGVVKRIPNGAAVLESGLRNVIHRAVDENAVPDKDFTVEDLAEHVGLLQPKAKVPNLRKRRA